MNVSGSEFPPAQPNPPTPEHAQRGSQSQLLASAIRRRVLASTLVDFGVAVIALMASATLVSSISPLTADWIFELSGLLTSALLVAGYSVLGIYTIPGYGPCERLRQRSLGAMIFAFAVTLVVASGNNGLASSALGLCCLGILIVVGYFGQEALRVVMGSIGGSYAVAAIVGTSELERKIAKGLLEYPEIGIRPAGFLALPDQSTVGVELPLPLLGRLDGSVVSNTAVEIGILPSSLSDRSEIVAKFGPLPFQHFATFRDMQALHAHRLRSGAILIDRQACFGRYPLHSMSGARLAMKRLIDVVLTVPLIILTLPILLLAIIAVRIIDPGNAVYVQRRVGLRGRPFGVYKIRTMYRDAEGRLERLLREDPVAAEQWRVHFKLDKDPRIIPGIGNILRRYSIDEIPQLWNVIKGDMSLVGPRPFPTYHLDSFDAAFQVERQTVMPGLTGLWQISSRSDGDLEQQKEQDLLYIKNWSLWLDLQILLQTLPAVLTAKGAR